MIFEPIRPQVETIISNAEKSVNERLLNICELFNANINYYNWVGFYFKNGNKDELKLGLMLANPQIMLLSPLEKAFVGRLL